MLGFAVGKPLPPAIISPRCSLDSVPVGDVRTSPLCSCTDCTGTGRHDWGGRSSLQLSRKISVAGVRCSGPDLNPLRSTVSYLALSKKTSDPVEIL